MDAYRPLVDRCHGFFNGTPFVEPPFQTTPSMAAPLSQNPLIFMASPFTELQLSWIPLLRMTLHLLRTASPCRQTDSCKDITLPKLRLPAVNMIIFLDHVDSHAKYINLTFVQSSKIQKNVG